MNALFVGAWLVISSTSGQPVAIPYSSMQQCHAASEQLDKITNDEHGCILGNNPMYGDIPKMAVKKK